MKSVFATLAALAATVVSAQIVMVTSPLVNTVYTAGTSAIITWHNPQVAVIPQIILARGPSTALQPESIIAENVDATTGSYTWNIPANITAGTDYALEFGVSPDIAFAGPFTIKSADAAAST